MSIWAWYKRRSSLFKDSLMVVLCLGVVFATLAFVGCIWLNSGCTLLRLAGPGPFDAGSPPPAPVPGPPDNGAISWLEVVSGAGVMALVGGGEMLRRKFFRRK